MKRRALPAAVALGLVLTGCSSISAPRWLWPFGDETVAAPVVAPLPPLGPVATPAPIVAGPPLVQSGDAGILGFHDSAEAFYKRLALRRFNTLATYSDQTLRGYFETQEGYSDYYARLAQELEDAHFEKNRPLAAELQEFTMDAPGRARVRYRLEGKSGRPLRFWSTSLEREDVWQQSNGRWWIVPGKL